MEPEKVPGQCQSHRKPQGTEGPRERSEESREEPLSYGRYPVKTLGLVVDLY
jgi:hypothetical protein